MIIRRLIGFTFITFGICGASYSIWTTALDNNLAAIRQKYLVVSGVKAKTDIKNPEARLFDFYQEAKQKLEKYTASSRAEYRIAQASLELGQIEKDDNEKTKLICAAYQAFDKSFSLSPFEFDYLLGRAQTEALLYKNNKGCAAFAPSKEHIIANVNQTLLNEPFVLHTLYQASEILLLIDENIKAFEILNKIQTLDVKISDTQKYFLYSLAKNPKDLNVLMPDVFPQIIDWIGFFAQQRRSDFIEWQEVFASKAHNALKNLQTRLSTGALSTFEYSYFIKEISRSALINFDDSLRKELDQLLADIYEIEGNQAWSSLLKERQTLERIRVLKAINFDDNSPATTMLSCWYPDHADYLLSFENNTTSIGLYIPPTSIPTLVFIEPKQTQSSLDINNLVFLASEDNINFYDFSSEVSLSEIVVDGKILIAARINKPAFRYLKIHAKKAPTRTAFSNSLAGLIQVYGASIKK